jgi:ribokinase
LKHSRPIDRVDCLGLGIVPLDFLVTVPHAVPPGGKVDGLSLCVQGGGPVPNALVGLSRLGCATMLIAAVGPDLIGRRTIEEMRTEKVTTRIVRRSRGGSDSAHGFVETGSGQRTIAFCRQVTIRPRDIVTSHLPLPRVVHLDGRHLEACLKLARWGRRVGAAITFDIGSMRNDVSPIFPLIDHLIVSDAFAVGFSGTKDMRQALRSLARFGPKAVVITRGTKGSAALEAGRYYRHPAFKVNAVDTTGAGDSFHAGYIYGLLKEYEMPERLRLGAAVAAIKCMQPGARAGNPTLKRLNQFLRGNPRTYA